MDVTSAALLVKLKADQMAGLLGGRMDVWMVATSVVCLVDELVV